MCKSELYSKWVILAALFTSISWAQPADKANLATEYLPKLEKILSENIAAFWYEKSLDREHGGYIINFDQQGRRKRPGTKMIVTQARTLWLFSRMARAGYHRNEYLDAAEVGYRFLTEKMWDPTHGGFYWEVDVTGDTQLKPNKHLYGQSFALYALSEYYLASGRRDVLDFAERFFKLLDDKAYDTTYGGYIEAFEPDWTPTPAGENCYMGTPSDLKLMNTHLHLMEAITTFFRASKSPVARARLLELVNIQSNAVVRKNLGGCTDKYERNWTPCLNDNYAQVSYGHDIENVWLLMDTCKALGLSNYPFGDLYATLFDYSLQYGYDQTNGGFYYTGPFNKPATDLSKSWWVQAEGLVSSLQMYRFTGDPKYRTLFQQIFAYIENNLIDDQYGEWHQIIAPDGTVRGDKASPWKAGYHNGRAMIECIEILKTWQNP